MDEFEAEVLRDDMSLARACLLLAKDAHPALDVDAHMALFAPWAARVRKLQVDGVDVPTALRRVLALDERFRGNVEDYEDPENSLLDAVLRRRTGLPITLSVVYLEVARRLGAPLVAVGMPGHFLVRYEDVLLDPFRGGIRMDEAEAQRILDAIYHGNLRLTPAMLQPTSDREVLARVMSNLKAAYARREMPAKAVRVCDRILQLNPYAFEEHRDRGLLKRALDDASWRDDMKRYLDALPKAPDAERVRALLRDA